MLDAEMIKSTCPALSEGSEGLVTTTALGRLDRGKCWYAAHTRGRHEKSVAKQLDEKCIGHFLPLYRSVRRWKDRRKELQLPLFPGYVFVHIDLQDRLSVLQIPGVVRLVCFGGQPAALDDRDIEVLRKGLTNGMSTEPWPYLRAGRKVGVKGGPLAGLVGFVVRKKDKFRVVLSIDLIQRSVAVEVDACDLEWTPQTLPLPQYRPAVGTVVG